MNIEELETTAAKLREDLAKLDQNIADLKNKPASGRVEPNGYYYYMDDTGEAKSSQDTNCRWDEQRLEVGNYFHTKEAAEREVERRKVIKRLRELAGGFKPDWKRERYNIIGYDHDNKEWFATSLAGQYQFGMAYFETQAKCQAAIDELGDRLNVLLEV